MKEYVFCGHTGSINRGADAIVKSTADLITACGGKAVLASYKKEEDARYGYSEYSSVIRYADYKKHFLLKLCAVAFRVLKKDAICESIRQIPIIRYLEKRQAISVSVGGDTYCYSMEPYQFQEMNRVCNEKGIPSVLWGCSIESDIKNQTSRLDDLKKYDYIFPREQESYNILVAAGISKDKLIKMCDPAFTLKPESVDIPKEWIEKGYIAINISPLPFNFNPNPEIVKAAYKKLIEYILQTTNHYVVMIPHVYQLDDPNYCDDLMIHRQIKELFSDDEDMYSRIKLIEKFYNSKQLKYIISQSKILIAARTHASIAGYSSFVPTLVIGYSIKAIGIARDLFETDRNYVVIGKEISEENELVDAYTWINTHTDEIEKRLREVMPAYIEQAKKAAEFLVSKFR